jgi:hypothetical protein
MHESTLIVLMFLTFGQIFMLTCGVLILWLAGDFGDAPKLFKGRHPVDQAEKTTIAVRQETGAPSNDNSDGLMALADDHSIQPQATEDGINPLEDDVDHSRDRAVNAERSPQSIR